MVGEALAGLGSLKKTAFDLAKGLKEIDDAARRNVAIIELQEKILAAQQSQKALMEQISTLEKEITNFETDDQDRPLVLVKASESRGGEWSPDDYYVRDSHGIVVGRIMRHPQAPEIHPWFWTITARQISPSVHNRGYSATREQAMADFRMRWAATTN